MGCNISGRFCLFVSKILISGINIRLVLPNYFAFFTLFVAICVNLYQNY